MMALRGAGLALHPAAVGSHWFGRPVRPSDSTALCPSLTFLVHLFSRCSSLLPSAGIMDGTDKPDYDACVAIVTREALKEMVWPALLALLLPVAVGFGFKCTTNKDTDTHREGGRPQIWTCRGRSAADAEGA